MTKSCSDKSARLDVVEREIDALEEIIERMRHELERVRRDVERIDAKPSDSYFGER